MREGSPNFEQIAREEAEAKKTQKTTALENLTPGEIDASLSKLEEDQNPLSDVSEKEIDKSLEGLE